MRISKLRFGRRLGIPSSYPVIKNNNNMNDFAKSAGNTVGNIVKKQVGQVAGNAIAEVVGNLAGNYTQGMVSKASDNVLTTINPGSRRRRNRNNGGGGNNGTIVPMNSSNNNRGNVGTTYLKPTSVSFNTPISNRVSNLYFNEGKPSYSPMHLTFARFELPTNENSSVGNYISNVIVPGLYYKLRAALNYSVDTSLVTFSKFTDAMNVLIEALNVYYFYNSILSFTQETRLTNDAMRKLREDISTQDLYILENMKTLLSEIPMPPRLLSFIIYLNQNFRTSSQGKAPIIKMVPVAFTTSFVPNSDDLAARYDALKSQYSFYGLLADACPNWKIGKLPDIGGNAVIDHNFTSLWKNLALVYQASGGTIKYVPTVNSTTASVPFACYTPVSEMDGWVQACSTINLGVSTVADFKPGLIYPVQVSTSTGALVNRISWTNDAGSPGSEGWQTAYANLDLAFGRGETNHLDGNNVNGLVSYATFSEYTEFRSIDQTEACAEEFVSFLLNLETIMPKQDRRFNRK